MDPFLRCRVGLCDGDMTGSSIAIMIPRCSLVMWVGPSSAATEEASPGSAPLYPLIVVRAMVMSNGINEGYDPVRATMRRLLLPGAGILWPHHPESIAGEGEVC